MRWDEIQKGMKATGNLVFAMDQGQTAPLTEVGPWGAVQTSPGKGGYCFGLAVEWVAVRYAGKDFPFDPRTLVCDYPPWQATRGQTILKGPGDTEHLVLADYGLTFNSGRETKLTSTFCAEDIAKAGQAGAGCYYVYVKGSSSAHALALQVVTNGEWRFFDANYGEFWFKDSDEFVGLANWYFSLAGYFKSYNKGGRIKGINPPPYVNERILKERTRRPSGIRGLD